MKLCDVLLSSSPSLSPTLYALHLSSRLENARWRCTRATDERLIVKREYYYYWWWVEKSWFYLQLFMRVFQLHRSYSLSKLCVNDFSQEVPLLLLFAAAIVTLAASLAALTTTTLPPAFGADVDAAMPVNLPKLGLCRRPPFVLNGLRRISMLDDSRVSICIASSLSLICVFKTFFKLIICKI